MAGLLDCLSALSVFSLVLCLEREGGYNEDWVWLALVWGLAVDVDETFSFCCFNLQYSQVGN